MTITRLVRRREPIYGLRNVPLAESDSENRVPAAEVKGLATFFPSDLI